VVVESASILGHVGILDCLRGGRVMALYIRIKRNHGYYVAVVGRLSLDTRAPLTSYLKVMGTLLLDM